MITPSLPCAAITPSPYALTVMYDESTSAIVASRQAIDAEELSSDIVGLLNSNSGYERRFASARPAVRVR